MQFRNPNSYAVGNVNYNLSVNGKVIRSFIAPKEDDIVAVTKDVAKLGQVYTLICAQMTKDHQGIKLEFVAPKQSFSQLVTLPYMPKINVALLAKKDNSLINGMEVIACNPREQLMNMISAKGVVNYSTNLVNKVVAAEQVAIFFYDPTDKYPYQGIITTVDSRNLAAVSFTVSENVALTAAFVDSNNKVASGLDVNVTVDSETR